MNPYIGEEDRLAMQSVKTYAELGQIALKVLRKMREAIRPLPVGQVCGPITTGGLGSIEANLKNFGQWVRKLQSDGLAIFDQIPFEEHMFRIWEANDRNDDSTLLEDFYQPIFKSGLITTLYFIPGWAGSNGATWEHRQAVQLGMEIKYL